MTIPVTIDENNDNDDILCIFVRVGVYVCVYVCMHIHIYIYIIINKYLLLQSQTSYQFSPEFLPTRNFRLQRRHFLYGDQHHSL